MAAGIKVGFNVTGIVPMVRRLENFENKLRTKVLRKCGNEASKRVLKIMKANAPAEPKGFRKSLGRKVKVFRNQVLFWAVGARTKYWLTLPQKAKWFRDKQGRRRMIPVTEKTPDKYATKQRLAARYVRKAEKLSGFVTQTVAASSSIIERAYADVLSEAINEA